MKQHMPNSILLQMKATGHCPHMSHPEETIQLISEYLASNEDRQSLGIGLYNG